jgi:hypothetical protein
MPSSLMVEQRKAAAGSLRSSFGQMVESQGRYLSVWATHSNFDKKSWRIMAHRQFGLVNEIRFMSNGHESASPRHYY